MSCQKVPTELRRVAVERMRAASVRLRDHRKRVAADVRALPRARRWPAAAPAAIEGDQ